MTYNEYLGRHVSDVEYDIRDHLMPNTKFIVIYEYEEILGYYENTLFCIVDKDLIIKAFREC